MRQRRLALVLVALWCVLALLVYRRGIKPTMVVEAQVTRDEIQSDTPISPKKSRPVVYRYALVPTGVHSLSDYYAALTDPAVLQAYSGVDVATLHFQKLKSPLCGYVAFKRNGFVQWTEHCISIKAGEEVLTDGHSMILARCGNLVSLMPQSPAGKPAVSISTLDDAFPPVTPPAVASAIPSEIPGSGGEGSPAPSVPPAISSSGSPPSGTVTVAPPASLPCCGGGVSLQPSKPSTPVSMADGDDNSVIVPVALVLLFAAVGGIALHEHHGKHLP
ncbi:MAG TPA: hypothetical protein VLV49_17620 [Terriglobales bacterium]|nr:hypothetical protein [Terriglobales bacterium]